MAELVEYCLVVMVSALFVAGSAATYGSFLNFEARVQFGASSSAVEGLAAQAVAEGRSEAELSLPASQISCSGETLLFTAGVFSAAEPVSLPCDFVVSVSQGVHVVAFDAERSALTVSVG
ncbi:MAG: hypothetical protein JRN21_05720 [Nitrososphaerota archaeon]|nr:hypothetical protein [Nitrososphaerota archaeon]